MIQFIKVHNDSKREFYYKFFEGNMILKAIKLFNILRYYSLACTNCYTLLMSFSLVFQISRDNRKCLGAENISKYKRHKGHTKIKFGAKSLAGEQKWGQS